LPITSCERHNATSAGVYPYENSAAKSLRLNACSGTLPAASQVNRLTTWDSVTGGMLLLNLVFW
jgi:hypothetical protein